MKKAILIILSTISLSGCVFQSVNQYDIQRAIAVCGRVEQIVEISASFLGSESVVCLDSKTENLK